MTVGDASQWLASIPAAMQITAIVWLFSRGWLLRYRMIFAACLLAVITAATIMPGLPIRTVGLTISGCCHAATYVGLLSWFAPSLRPNHEPVVTGLARQVRRTMPDEVVRYNRHVTIAWCVFFAGQLLVSLILLCLAPPSVWSDFINLMNLPLVAAMALGEFGYRTVLFRHEPRTSLFDTLAALRRARLMQAPRP
jgi:uncharacterized membrane protein